MSNDIQKTLKLEIENYLQACGLLETLEVFRKEYGDKLKSINSESSFKCKKSSLAKRYLGNESEINKTYQKSDHARKKLAASMKKLAQLNAKLVSLEKMCSKHILFNLELVNIMEAKVLNSSFQDSRESITVNNNQDKVLDFKNLFEHLAEKIFSIYCNDKISRVDDQKLVGSPNSLTFNKVVDCQNPAHPNTSDNTCIFSDFNIIPDNKLTNISPLLSSVSLSSCKFPDFNLTPMHNNNNNIGTVSNSGSSEATVLKNSSSVSATIIGDSCRENSSENLNASLNSLFTLESSLSSTAKTYYWDSVSNSSCVSCYSQKISANKFKSNRKSGLRSWCEAFLKNSGISNKDSSDAIYKAKFVNHVNYHNHSLHSSNLSFCESNGFSDLETSYAETSFTDNILHDSTATTTDITSSFRSCSSKSIADSVYSCRKRDSELLGQSQFLKQRHGFCRKNIEVNIADKHASHLQILKDKPSNIRVVNNDKNVAKKFFSDAYLLKTGNKMVDKEDYNTSVDSNTPIKNKVKVGKREFCIFNSHQVPNGDLSTTYTIQGRSRLRIPQEKETLFSDEAVRCSKNEAYSSLSRSDKSKDRVQKGGKLFQNSDRKDLKENFRRSGIIKDSESVNSFKRQNSDISQNDENKLKIVQNNARFRDMKSLQHVPRDHIISTEEVSDSCDDFSEINSINSLDSWHYPSEHNQYKTIPIENITNSRRGKFQSEKQSINYTFHCVDKGGSLISTTKISGTRRKVKKGKCSDFDLSTNCAKSETFREKLAVDSRHLYNDINKCIQNTEFCSCCQNILPAKSPAVGKKSPVCRKCFFKIDKNELKSEKMCMINDMPLESKQKFQNLPKREIRRLKMKSRGIEP